MHDDGVSIELEAAGGLTARVDRDGVRLGYAGHDDWFGPGGLRVTGADVALDDARQISGVDDLGAWRAATWLSDRSASPRIDASLAAYDDRPVLVFSLRAPVGVDADLATGVFGEPSVCWPVLDPSARRAGGVPDDAVSFGYQYMEFALPTSTDPGCADFLRWPVRPSVMMPLLMVSGRGALLLAPLDHEHEQVIAVPADGAAAADGIRCGWHGDLTSVPKGFSTELAVVAGSDARDCLDRWAGLLVERAGTDRLPRGIDTLGSHVSYWTDNGAAYWYRTEGGRSVTDTLVDTVEDLRDRDVPVGAVQLDSWFYPHRVVRPFDTDEWDVPPTGLVRWEARDDLLPEGVRELRRALGDPPLVVHCRHLSSNSPYVDEYDCWVDGEYAHPVGSDLYETYLDQARSWGVETFEHDWLVECFLGVRQLREQPGRATRWQQGLDRALAQRGMTAQWCMATPADMMATARLAQVTSIRTSGDHGYLVPPELLWAWFLYTNALVRPFGLWPYKDVFRSDGHGGSTDPDAEAALAALSAGPVGIGDPLGAADRDLVLRCARADGLLVAPDAPIAATARSFLRHGVLHPEPVVGASHTLHPAGRWSYVITMNCHADSEHLATTVGLDDLGADRPAGSDGTPAVDAVVWDWRRGTVERCGPEGFDVELAAKGWDLRVVAPLLADGRLAVIGDADRYATAGRQRVATVEDHGDRVRVRLAGADESVRLVGWTPNGAGVVVSVAGEGTPSRLPVRVAPDGRWEVLVELPSEPGSLTVDLRVE